MVVVVTATCEGGGGGQRKVAVPRTGNYSMLCWGWMTAPRTNQSILTCRVCAKKYKNKQTKALHQPPPLPPLEPTPNRFTSLLPNILWALTPAFPPLNSSVPTATARPTSFSSRERGGARPIHPTRDEGKGRDVRNGRRGRRVPSGTQAGKPFASFHLQPPPAFMRPTHRSIPHGPPHLSFFLTHCPGTV